MATPLAGSASAAVPVIVTCNTFAGTALTGANAGGCTQPRITGGSGHLTVLNRTSTKFKIVWKTGKTTLATTLAPKPVTPNRCPRLWSELRVTGTVTGGTATPLIGGKTTNLICVTGTGTRVKFEILPGTKYRV
jgi:hypothetical protein